MPSIKSRIFNFAIRNRHILRGNLKKETFDFSTSIAGFREQCEKGAKSAGVDITFRPGPGMVHCYTLAAKN